MWGWAYCTQQPNIVTNVWHGRCHQFLAKRPNVTTLVQCVGLSHVSALLAAYPWSMSHPTWCVFPPRKYVWYHITSSWTSSLPMAKLFWRWALTPMGGQKTLGVGRWWVTRPMGYDHDVWLVPVNWLSCCFLCLSNLLLTTPSYMFLSPPPQQHLTCCVSSLHINVARFPLLIHYR